MGYDYVVDLKLVGTIENEREPIIIGKVVMKKNIFGKMQNYYRVGNKNHKSLYVIDSYPFRKKELDGIDIVVVGSYELHTESASVVLHTHNDVEHEALGNELVGLKSKGKLLCIKDNCVIAII